MAQPDINAWASGQLGAATGPAAAPAAPTFTPDADVNVVAPDGQAGTVKGHSVDAFLRAGYQLEGDAQTHERVLQKQYGDAPVAAGALGVARGVTFGLSDVAARALGAREGVEAYERFNPTASTVGEVVGGVGGAFIPGLGVAGDLGHLAEEGVAGSSAVRAFAEGGKFAKVAARYAPALARGAVEGGMYGAGGGLSQAALSADPMTAEAVLGDMATGALLGAGTGVVMEAGGRFLKDSSAWAMKSHEAAAAADALAPTAAAEPAAEGGAIPVEHAPSGVAEGSGPVRAARPEPVADHLVEDFKTKYHRMTVASRQNVRQFEGLVAKGKATPEMEAALTELEAARAKTQSMLPTEGSADASRTYELHEKTGKQGKISREMWTADNAGIAEAAQRPGFREAMAEHQQALDHAQEALGNRKYPAVVEADHPIFGGGPRNGLSPEATALAEGLSKPPTARVGKPKRLGAEAAKNLFGLEAPTAAENALADRVTAATRNDLPAAKVEPGHSGQTLAGELHSRLAHHASTGVAHSVQAAALQLAGIGGGYSLGRLAHHYVKEETGSNLLGYLAGAIAGVPVAMLMSHTIRAPLAALLRGKGAIADAIAGRAGKGMGRLAGAVDGVVGGKGIPIARRVASGILGAASFAVGADGEKPKGTPFQQRATEMGNVLANPAKARTAIHQNLAGVRAADPMLSDQMEELAFARLMFLGDKMPKDPRAGAQLGKRAPWHPTDAEQSKWARYIDAAEHPEHVLHAVAAGTVTLEQVETLEKLYPTTYERVRADIVARSAELQSTLPWDKRLSLSVLFHQPVDDILQPQNVAAMQKTFVDMETQKQDGAPSPMTGAIKPAQPTPAQQRAAGI